MIKPFELVVFVVAAVVLVLTRRDFRRGLLSERVVILWTAAALGGAILACVPEPFVMLFRRAGVVNYPSAPITLSILFLFLLSYSFSRKLGRLSQMTRRLAVRDAVLQVKAQADKNRGEKDAPPERRERGASTRDE